MSTDHRQPKVFFIRDELNEMDLFVSAATDAEAVDHWRQHFALDRHPGYGKHCHIMDAPSPGRNGVIEWSELYHTPINDETFPPRRSR